MYHAIVFLPLIGFLIAGLFGRAIGARGTQEKRITLAAALELKRQLDAAGRCTTVPSDTIRPTALAARRR
jgi:N-acetylmuramoyl-L-alanine amidase